MVLNNVALLEVAPGTQWLSLITTSLTDFIISIMGLAVDLLGVHCNCWCIEFFQSFYVASPFSKGKMSIWNDL